MAMWWIYPVLGIAAGILSGLLGIGGGLLLVGALILVLPSQGIPASIIVPVALASSLASIVLTGLSSAWSHHKRDAVLWPTVLWLVPGLLFGAIVASIGVAAWAGPNLRWAVVVYCVLVAVQLISQWPAAKSIHTSKVVGWPWTLTGLVIGAISSVVGIGGGSMTVPALVWRGVPVVKAVATSAVCGVFIAIASALTYSQLSTTHVMPEFSYGFVYLPAALGVASASILFAPLGARWAHQLPAVWLKRIFAVFLLLMAALLALKS